MVKTKTGRKLSAFCSPFSAKSRHGKSPSYQGFKGGNFASAKYYPALDWMDRRSGPICGQSLLSFSPMPFSRNFQKFGSSKHFYHDPEFFRRQLWVVDPQLAAKHNYRFFRVAALVKDIAELTVETISPEQVKQIFGYLDTWDSVSFDDKRRVLDLLIATVEATSDKMNITWKI